MSVTKKIIEFNPAFLGAGGSSKTKKNRAPRVAPLISPNVLRNRLLKRIKEHKKKELSISGGKVSENTINSSILDNTEERNNNVNEFDDSFTFLEDLAKKKQQTSNVLNKSIKHRPLFKKPPPQDIHLDLPDELKPETTFTVSPPSVLFPTTTNVSYSVKSDDVPYGILKGGSKPTFRDWNKTRKNLEPITTVGAGIPDNSHSQKLKDLQLKLNAKSAPTLPQLQPLPQTNPPPVIIPQIQPPKSPLMSGGKPNVKPAPLGKKLLKRTIRRKYTLGKSKLKKSVSILLKDRETRKNVLVAHRALKTVPLSDINVYLKKQNLIKIGSAAPADVVRQIYESALLAGEITNVNKDTLLHNFIKGESDTLF
jgi:hypothetical protein